jgi:hypothetical protein
MTELGQCRSGCSPAGAGYVCMCIRNQEDGYIDTSEESFEYGESRYDSTDRTGGELNCFLD